LKINVSNRLKICYRLATRLASGGLLMKTMLLAAFGVLALGAGAASAQPGSAGSSTGPYGQAWAEIHRAKCQNAK
jgi:hypothetical protein